MSITYKPKRKKRKRLTDLGSGKKQKVGKGLSYAEDKRKEKN